MFFLCSEQTSAIVGAGVNVGPSIAGYLSLSWDTLTFTCTESGVTVALERRHSHFQIFTQWSCSYLSTNSIGNPTVSFKLALLWYNRDQAAHLHPLIVLFYSHLRKYFLHEPLPWATYEDNATQIAVTTQLRSSCIIALDWVTLWGY